MNDYILTLVILSLLYIFIMWNGNEKFANKNDKANTIYQWFQKITTPSYERYKHDLGANSNYIEYEEISKLSKKPNFTTDSILRVL